MKQSSALKFRLATREDVPALVLMLAEDELAAQRELLTDPLPDSYYLAFDAIAADAQNEILVAESAGRVIGALQITYLPNMNYQGSWRALIESVRIAENFRGGGAGSALMQAAIERSRQRGCRIVQLTTEKRRARAKRFYEKLGFCATHEGMKLHLR